MRNLLVVITLLLALTAQAQVKTEKAPINLTGQQEALYKALLPELRCLVCQNESLAESQADLAADLRYEVRGLVAQGKDEVAVKKYLTDRYGDFILYKPPLEPRTVVLWFGPFVLLFGALLAVVVYARRTKPLAVATATSQAADAAALKKILDEPSP